MKLKPPNDRKPTKNREGEEVIFWPTLSPLSNPRGKLSKTPRCSSTSGIIANNTWSHSLPPCQSAPMNFLKTLDQTKSQ